MTERLGALCGPDSSLLEQLSATAMPYAHGCHLRTAATFQGNTKVSAFHQSHCMISKLFNLRAWVPNAPSSTPQHASLRCHSVREQVTALTSNKFLQALQNRQTKRLSPDLLDEEGRFMLKNLTKAQLLEWVATQGAFITCKNYTPCTTSNHKMQIGMTRL